MGLTKQEAILKLEMLLSRIPSLEKQKSFSEDFVKWQHDARALLKHVFPRDREYVKEFDDISYHLGFFTDATPESTHQEAFHSGLGSARAMLQSRIDEIAQFWEEPEKGAAPEVAIIETAQSRPESDRGTASNGVIVSPEHPELVFVIHGRQLLGEFHIFLRALGLKPLEWSKARSLTGKPNPYTWEIVDKALTEAGAIVALLTPDDEARLEPHLLSEHDSLLEKEYMPQPRQNVLFEAGVAYGRAPLRTILVRVGSQRPISDLAGHHILQLDDSPQSRQAVADALRMAGCPVDLTGADWFRSGTFSLAEQPRRSGDDAEKVRHAGTLLFLKTRLRGYTELVTAASVVPSLHSFFRSNPEYLNPTNVAFLEKYPDNFREQVAYGSASVTSLDELKRDVQSLQIE